MLQFGRGNHLIKPHSMSDAEKIIALKTLFRNRPSVLRNSSWVWVIRITAWLSAIASFAMGLWLLLEGLDEYLHRDMHPKHRVLLFAINTCLALLFFLFPFACWFVSYLCRVILKRNGFIMEVEEVLEKETRI